MKRILFSLTLLAAAPLAAKDFTALQAIAPNGIAESRAAAPAVPAPAPAVAPVTMQESCLELDRCWTRNADQRADALGLPREFCLKKAGLRTAAEDKTIFSLKTAMMVETPAGGLKPHISGFARTGRDWTITGDLFSAPAAPDKCGTLNSAFAAIYLVSSLDGNVKAVAPEIRGFLMDTSAMCASPAKSVEFLYKPMDRTAP